MVDVKICGLTRAVDAEFADANGAAYLGVIFAGGPRMRSPEHARDVLAGRRARKVGVFGEQTAKEIAHVAELVGLDVIQLHGAPDVGRVAECRAQTGREIWAVIRSADGSLPAHAEELADAADALLIDALVSGNPFGGTGKVVPWLELGESLDAMTAGHRIGLAGGLTPMNVGEAIDYVSPMIVDVSSGVESEPGIKDSRRIREFITAVRIHGRQND